MRMISYKQHAELLKKLSKQISYLQYFLPWDVGMPMLTTVNGQVGVYQTYHPITEKYADIRTKAEAEDALPKVAAKIGVKYEL